MFKLAGLLSRVAQVAGQNRAACYLVGGSVRDLLLGRAVGDLDLVVEGDARQLARTLAGELGAAPVVLDEQRRLYRLVGRGQKWQLDLEGIAPGGLVEDLRRRDFTINALALPLDALQVDRPGEGGSAAAVHGDMAVQAVTVGLEGAARPAAAGALPRGRKRLADGAEELARRVIDPAGGLADLRGGLIRAVGGSSLRDDPLRCLRAFRLAGQLGFALEAGTVRLIREAAPGLASCAGERICAELAAILREPFAAARVREMEEAASLWSTIFPFLLPLKGMEQGGHHVDDVWEHSVKALQYLEEFIQNGWLYWEGNRYREAKADGDAPDSRPGGESAAPPGEFGAGREYLWQPLAGGRPRLFVLKLACLLHDAGKQLCRCYAGGGKYTFYNHHQLGRPLALQAARRLRLSRRETELLALLVEMHMQPLFLYKSSGPGGLPGSRALHRLYRRVGGEMPGLLALSLADVASSRLAAGRREECELYRQFIGRLWQHWRRQAGASSPPRLLDGRDICRLLGVRPGPLVGRLLEELAVAQLEGRVRDRAQAEELVRRLAGEI